MSGSTRSLNRKVETVHWSPRYNSYAKGDFTIGAGEIRWDVRREQIGYALKIEHESWFRGGDAEEQFAAARHFGLV